jgi:hypothetical protein
LQESLAHGGHHQRPGDRLFAILDEGQAMPLDGVGRRAAGNQGDLVTGISQARTQISPNCSGAKD